MHINRTVQGSPRPTGTVDDKVLDVSISETALLAAETMVDYADEILEVAYDGKVRQEKHVTHPNFPKMQTRDYKDVLASLITGCEKVLEYAAETKELDRPVLDGSSPIYRVLKAYIANMQQQLDKIEEFDVNSQGSPSVADAGKVMASCYYNSKGKLLDLKDGPINPGYISAKIRAVVNSRK